MGGLVLFLAGALVLPLRGKTSLGLRPSLSLEVIAGDPCPLGSSDAPLEINPSLPPAEEIQLAVLERIVGLAGGLA